MKKSFLILLLLTTSLTSCSWIFGGDDDVEPEPEKEAEELAPSTVPLAEMPERELFARGKLLYQAQSYLLARDAFQSLKDGYPSGAYTEFAEVKIADCLFLGKQYEDAALAYEDLLKNRPSSQSIPYALFQLGRSFESINKGVGRDREPLEKAAQYYDRLITEHSDSPYTQAAKHYKEKAFKRLAYHEQKVLDFYKDKGAEAAYEARKEEFDEKWSSHIAAEVPAIAVSPIVATEGIEANTPTTAPTTTLTTDSVITADTVVEPMPVDEVEGLQEQEIVDVPVETVKVRQREQGRVRVVESMGSTLEAPKKTYRIREVGCGTRNGRKISIHIDSPFADEAYLSENKFIEPLDGVLTLNMPLTFETDITVDCFDTQDLSLDTKGTVKLKTRSEATLLSADNPPRLLIFLED